MEIINLSLPLFGLIFIGFVSAKFKRLNESALGWMNFFIIYVALPALFFQLIRKAPLDSFTNYKYIAATTGATILMFVFAYLAGRKIFKNRSQAATIQAVAASYANIGYMGPAITLSALGKAALIPTVIIFCFDNAFLFIITPLLMSLSTKNQSTSTVAIIAKALKKVFTHPFIVATLLGIIASANNLQLPVSLETILSMLSNTAAPAALFTMGVVIAHRDATINRMDIPFILVCKLILHPVCVYLLIKTLGPFDAVWEYTAILMACLPPALNIYVMASDYKVYVKQASSIVLTGTLLAFASVTYVLYLIDQKII